MNWTLLAVILILALAVGIGAAKGLIKMVFAVLVLMVTVILTTVITPWLSSFLKRVTNWDESLRNRVEIYCEDNDMLMSTDGTPELEDSHLPAIIAGALKEDAAEIASEGAEKYNDFVVDSITNMIFRAMVYIGTFIVLYIFLRVIGMILDLVSKLPVLNQVNRLGGALVGIVGGLIAIWTFFIIVTSLGSTKFAIAVSDQINDNAVLSFLYEKNLIQNIILNLF